MPELPEVETIRRGLAKSIVGKRVSGVRVLREKSFKGDSKEIIGKTVKSVNRRAKLIVIELQSTISNQQSATYLIIHLKMTGQLIYKLQIPNDKLQIEIQNSKFLKSQNKRSPYDIDGFPNKYTRVIVEFGDGSKLFFNDLRVFGWMRIAKSQKLKAESLDEIIGEKFGPEVFSKEFSLEYFKDILGNWGRPVKLLLMDQKKLAGVGNIYANEALFCAGIAPHHRGRDLVKDHPERVMKLYGRIKKVLKMGLKYGGSTGSDNAYLNVKGEKGRMQEHLMVYGKMGEDCPNKCGKKIRRMILSGRGTFFCPRCQR